MKAGVDFRGLGDTDQLRKGAVLAEEVITCPGTCRKLRNGSCGRHIGVTGSTPTCAELELVEDAEFLDELLVAEIPGSSE